MKTLRPYQNDCIEKLKESFLKFKKHLVVLPTGAGKTFTISQFLKFKNKKCLFLAHTREILEQTEREFSKSLDPDNFEVISVQKAIRNLDLLSKQNFEIIIIDECHRSASNSYLKIINYLQKKNVHLIGLTATPFRGDKKSIYEIFGLPVFSLTILDLIKQNYLCDFKGYRVKTNTSLRGISTKEGDFVASKLSAVINVKNRNELILKQYLKLDSTDKVLAFCVSINHAKALNKLFKDSGIMSDVIYGSMNLEKRKRILHQFKNGEIKIIFNCQILTEGFDEPSINTIFMCRPTVSKTLYIQMIGRGARLSLGKEYCSLYEFTDNDYDVCSLQDILDKDIKKKIIMKQGESFKDLAVRIENLKEEGVDIHKEEIQLIKRTFYEKEATPWQLNTLNKSGIKYQLPLTEHAANILLGVNNGNY